MGQDNSKIKKEIVPMGKNSPMTKSELINLIKIGEDSMVKIYSNQGNGSGFFCFINDPSINFNYALFTNNHVLGKENINIGERISFEYKSELKNFTLDENRKVFTNEELDYTCIEIKKEDNFKDFFLIDEFILNYDENKYKNKDIIILQFPNGGEISFSDGKIMQINENKILYTSSTEEGSSGSPLIIRKNVQKYYVIGIHVGGFTKKNCNIGSNIKSILNDIKMKNKFPLQSNNLDDIQSTQNLDNYKIVNDEEKKKGFIIQKEFKIFCFDNTSNPSLFEFYFSKLFTFIETFYIFLKYKNNYYYLLFENGGINGFRNIHQVSPLTIIIFKVDDDISELSDFIKRIREKPKKFEIFLVWNAYGKIDKRTIGKFEEEQFTKKNEIKYSLEISNKEDIQYFFKKILQIALSMKEYDHIKKNETW